MIDVPNDEIFVAIAAYREPELRQTIEHCITMAEQPERLRFGVCLQYELDGPPETRPDCLDGVDAHIRIAMHHWTESKGGCWARDRAQRLHGGEGFTMQIDSHMRMAPGWDRVLIDQMRSLPGDKPMITGHCPLYEVIDGEDRIPTDKTVPVTVFERISKDGWIWHPGLDRPDVPSVGRPTRAMSGAFVFTLGIWNIEVHQDPEHLYTGEELALTIRSFTHGYDLWNPPSVVAWHRMHPQGNKKFIYDGDSAEVSMREQQAFRRLRVLHRGDPDRILGRYGIGTVRSVAEYHEWAGIDVDTWMVTDEARDGVTPLPFSRSW